MSRGMSEYFVNNLMSEGTSFPAGSEESWSDFSKCYSDVMNHAPFLKFSQRYNVVKSNFQNHMSDLELNIAEENYEHLFLSVQIATYTLNFILKIFRVSGFPRSWRFQQDQMKILIQWNFIASIQKGVMYLAEINIDVMCDILQNCSKSRSHYMSEALHIPIQITSLFYETPFGWTLQY